MFASLASMRMVVLPLQGTCAYVKPLCLFSEGGRVKRSVHFKARHPGGRRAGLYQSVRQLLNRHRQVCGRQVVRRWVWCCCMARSWLGVQGYGGLGGVGWQVGLMPTGSQWRGHGLERYYCGFLRDQVQAGIGGSSIKPCVPPFRAWAWLACRSAPA